jgi:hypothetical protein
MADRQDPGVEPLCPPAELGYVIRSARAVIEALIARDQTAAEEAALRTCQDCDLLIRLIRDLATLLRDPLNQEFGFDPVATAALVDRAQHMLALVDSPPSRKRSVGASDCDHDGPTLPIQNRPFTSSSQQTHDTAHSLTPQPSRRGTVASLGLRVRLVPFEADHDIGSVADEQADDASQSAPGDVPRGRCKR